MFCCTSSKKSKNKSTEKTLETSKSNSPRPVPVSKKVAVSQIADLVFVAGQGWVPKSTAYKRTQEEEESEQKPSEGNWVKTDRQAALDLLQGLASTEKQRDLEIERRSKDMKQRFESRDENLGKPKILEVVIDPMTLLAGDQAPPDDNGN